MWCRCYPADDIKLKNEPSFGVDKCTVSWHADSSLEHYSTIAVYHCTDSHAAGPLVSKDCEAVEGSGHKHKKQKKERKHGNMKCSSDHNVSGTDTGEDLSWRVAMRVWPNAEGPTAGRPVPPEIAATLAPTDTEKCPPYVAVPLPSDSVYYLLDDFNHHHQHSGTYSHTLPCAPL